MPFKVENDKGEEIEVHTTADLEAAKAAEAERVKAEYEAKLLDKDNHMKQKLDEFQQGKSSQELKDQERDAAIADAKKVADEANLRVANSEQRRLDALKNIAMNKYVGDSAELKAKFDESWNLVNLDIKEDSDISKKAELVANMIGLNQTSVGLGNMPMGGGGSFAPKVSAVEKEKQDAEYEKFKGAFGLSVPKIEENK